MKRIRIFGCQFEPSLKEDLRSATIYYRDLLLPRKRKLDITIVLKKNLLDDRGIFGECWDNDYHAYNIVIDKNLSYKNKLVTLAHEMVHVKQFARGQLKFGCGKDKWLGKAYPIDMPYNKLPWEKEAEEFEGVIYRCWKKHQQLIKLIK